MLVNVGSNWNVVLLMEGLYFLQLQILSWLFADSLLNAKLCGCCFGFDKIYFRCLARSRLQLQPWKNRYYIIWLIILLCDISIQPVLEIYLDIVVFELVEMNRWRSNYRSPSFDKILQFVITRNLMANLLFGDCINLLFGWESGNIILSSG